MEKLTDKNLTEFTEVLAAKTSVPGGGGAAALAGALAVSLGSMAANFTVGKKKFLEHDGELKTLLSEAEGLRVRLLDLVEKDAESFEPLSKAYGIPKEDPAREEALESATLLALQPPLEMMREIAKVIDLLERLTKMCSALMISDVACGAYLAEAALKSASVNVYVNTKALKDREKALKFDEEVDGLLRDYVPRAENVSKEMTARVRGTVG